MGKETCKGVETLVFNQRTEELEYVYISEDQFYCEVCGSVEPKTKQVERFMSKKKRIMCESCNSNFDKGQAQIKKEYEIQKST